MSGIQEAVDKAGNQEQLAKLLGVKQQAVQQWRKRGYAPIGRVVEIESHTGVPRERLCDPKLSDIFRPFTGG